MRWLALICLSLLPLVSACAGGDGPFVTNRRCRCAGGAYCVMQVGGEPAPLTCQVAPADCASLSNDGRRCWGSLHTSGLCLCKDKPAKLAAR